MKVVNFKKFEMYEDISQTRTISVDVRQEFADNLYKQGHGIEALDLAMRIYKTDGPVEFNKHEFAVLEEFVLFGTPRFIESFKINVRDTGPDGM